MSQIALIALDLDGTLLNSEKKISTRNRVALAAARAQGIKVVLTTGRPLKAMDFLLEELETAGLKEEYTIQRWLGAAKQWRNTFESRVHERRCRSYP